MYVVANAKLIGDSEQEGVGLRNGFILPELLDQNIRLTRVVLYDIFASLPLNQCRSLSQSSGQLRSDLFVHLENRLQVANRRSIEDSGHEIACRPF